ncbi:MAG TPA: DUF2127 domain-containing protein [Polyangiaceae bacterium]|nr:DUF2127 domain-containing protein [Polyangiaceae bacterium]
MAQASRPRALVLIIAYKAVKAPIVLALAAYLALYPGGALHATLALAHDLSEGGALLARLARWLERHVTLHVVTRGAMLAALDGVTTALEAFLLWRGHPLGEWIVTFGLAALVPFEVLSLERHPGVLRLVVLALNTAIVVYLARRRWTARSERPLP